MNGPAGRMSLCPRNRRSFTTEYKRRVEAAAARNDEPLTPAERTELARLRKQVAEQEKDIAFLKMAPAYAGDRCQVWGLSSLVGSSR
jgi:predicted phage gp36 major capsid-like protein